MNASNNPNQPQLIPARIADALYDDLWLPEEALSVRKLVRDFVEREVRPVAHELNNTPESLEAFPRELVGKMGEAGLLGLPFEQCYGGAALQYPALATMVMLEEVAYVSSGLAAAMVDVQLILVASLLLGTPALSLIGAIGAALTLGLRSGGVLLALLVLPLYIPVLIFGAGAVEATASGLGGQAHLSMLAAILVGSMVLAPLATAAALRVAED